MSNTSSGLRDLSGSASIAEKPLPLATVRPAPASVTAACRATSGLIPSRSRSRTRVPGARGRVARFTAERSATVSGERTKPPGASMPVGQGRRLGRAGLDDSRRFERGKRRQLAHQRSAAARGRPEHDVVQLAPGCRLVDEEPADPDPDPDDGGHRRLCANPAGSLPDGGLPRRQGPGIGWPAGAVAGAGEIEAEDRIPVRGQVRGPIAHGTMRGDLLPAERRRQQDRRPPARLVRRPVDDEESPWCIAEVDDLVGHDSGTSSGASRLSARTDTPAATFATAAAVPRPQRDQPRPARLDA